MNELNFRTLTLYATLVSITMRAYIKGRDQFYLERVYLLDLL